MARRTPEHYFNAIEAVVRDHGAPMSVSEIAAALEQQMPRRTLQGRIAALVRNARLAAEGTGRATRYRSPPDVTLEVSASAGRPEARVQVDVYPTVSETGASIRKYVTQPLAQREPVGYRQAFLDGYRPDRPYLSAEDLGLLHRLGRTSVRRQPAGTHARQVRARLMVDLSWNSSRLEGNPYSLLDTQRLLDLGSEATGKRRDDARMILNHRAAIAFLLDENAEIGFNRHTVCSLHALLSSDLLPDPGALGRLRTTIVGVEGSCLRALGRASTDRGVLRSDPRPAARHRRPVRADLLRDGPAPPSATVRGRQQAAVARRGEYPSDSGEPCPAFLFPGSAIALHRRRPRRIRTQPRRTAPRRLPTCLPQVGRKIRCRLRVHGS